jgi:hypothetical protein
MKRVKKVTSSDERHAVVKIINCLSASIFFQSLSMAHTLHYLNFSLSCILGCQQKYL